MIAIQRNDPHHTEKQKVFAQRRNSGPIDLLWLGDSLTRRWEDYPDLWESLFGGFYPANFGVGADTLENLLWRLQAGNIERLEPRVTVLLIGTNNLSTHTGDYIYQGIVEIAHIIEQQLPHTHLLIQGLYPRAAEANGTCYNATIRKINTQLYQDFALSQQCTFSSLGDIFFHADQQVNTKFLPDGLHLNKAGYALIGPILQHLISGLFQL